MKTLLHWVTIGLVSAWGFSALPARADLEVSAAVRIHAKADFYAPLEPHGVWLEVPGYGRCWRPRVAVAWRPYCEGHWVWTECGWYWASDEPWGWACYHYGCWYDHPAHGWIWVPGIEWAPAWVTWRVGGGFIGWAPLPPPHVVVAAPAFAFVEIGHFNEPIRRSKVIVNKTTIINKTKVVNNIKTENRVLAGGTQQKVVVNEGPGVEEIRKATGKTIQVASIREAALRTEAQAPADLKSRSKKERVHPPGNVAPPAVSGDKGSPPARGPEPKAKAVPPGKGSEPPSGVQPTPDQPTAPPKQPPPGKGHGKGKHKGKGKEKP